MYSRAGIIATTAAGTSLVVHALLFSAFRVIHVPVYQAPAPQPELAEVMVVYDPPADEFPIGEVGAKGYASHRVSGDREAVAPQAPVDQAALSLDPVGPDRVVEKPQDSVGDPVAEMPALPRVVPVLARSMESLQARLPEITVPPHEPVLAPDTGSAAAAPDPRPLIAAPPPVPPLAPAPPAVELPAVAIVRAEPAPAVPAAAPSRPPGGQADPAPMSDSESDPFSVLGTAYYHDGRLSVRAGRKIRSRRPRIGLAGQVDLYQRRTAQVTLRVSTDAAGKVTGVEVARSSGSNEIDQPCRVAMYDWWFEPKKDAAGNPMADTFSFTIAFQ